MLIEREQRGPVLHLRLHRPEQRNAMSSALILELGRILENISDAPDIAVLILSGAGAGFCAGSDLAEIANIDIEAQRELEEASGRVSRQLSALPIPVVAAVHGFAIGGGLTLAASCDIVVSEAAARWSLPEVPIGLFPAWGLAPVIARVGPARARRLCWGIDVLDGNEALATGLADHVTGTNVETVACDIATKLSLLPRQQSAAVKDYFANRIACTEADSHANEHFLAAVVGDVARQKLARYRNDKNPEKQTGESKQNG